MSQVFFTSDLHFGHHNLIESLRNMSVEEHDQLIIDNWNKTINSKDTVYVLGDITMEKHNTLEYYLKQLSGNICIVGGNHDTKRCCKKLMELGITTMGVLNYKGFICTHIPIHEYCLNDCRGNIHGHIHQYFEQKGFIFQSNIVSLGSKYINVNIELCNYTPISFNEIERQFNLLKYEI